MNNHSKDFIINKIKQIIPYNSDVFLLRRIIDINIYTQYYKISITIPYKNNDHWEDQWEDIKRRIELQLTSSLIKECPICFNDTQVHDEELKYIISCNNCSAQFCNPCFIEMTRKNIIDDIVLHCPFCRFCYKGEIPTFISIKEKNP